MAFTARLCSRASDDLLRVPVRDHGQAVGPLDLVEGGNDALLERFPRRLLNQMRDGLGVGLRDEPVAGLLEADPQQLRILDDAVVHDGD